MLKIIASTFPIYLTPLVPLSSQERGKRIIKEALPLCRLSIYYFFLSFFCFGFFTFFLPLVPIFASYYSKYQYL